MLYSSVLFVSSLVVAQTLVQYVVIFLYEVRFICLLLMHCHCHCSSMVSLLVNYGLTDG